MAGARIDEVEENVFNVSSRINSTWGGSLVDMVRCQIILEAMESNALVENAANVGETLLEGLQELGRTFEGQIENVRGRGFFCAFDCATGELRDRLLKACLEKRLLALPCGPIAIRLRPALTLSREEALEGVDRIRQAIESL